MSAIWDRTAAFLSERARMIAPFALAAIGVPTALAALIAPLAEGGSMAARIGVALAGLTLSLIGYWGRIVVMTAAMAPEQGMAARRLATRRFPALVGVALLIGIAMMIALSPIWLILAMHGVPLTVFAGATEQVIPPEALFQIALYLLLLAPILILIGARLALIAPVVIAEGLGIGAIGRSVALTRGITWRLIGVILLYGIVSTVLTLAVTAGLGTVLMLALGGEGPWAPGVLVTLVVLALLETALGVVVAVFIGKLYLAAAARVPVRDAAPGEQPA